MTVWDPLQRILSSPCASPVLWLMVRSAIPLGTAKNNLRPPPPVANSQVGYSIPWASARHWPSAISPSMSIPIRPDISPSTKPRFDIGLRRHHSATCSASANSL